MKKIIPAVVLFLCAACSICAGVTFDDAVANMLQSSPTIKSSLMGFYAGKAALSRETGNRYDLRLNSGYSYGIGYGGGNILTGDNGNLNAGITENLPTGGSISANIYGNNYTPQSAATLNDNAAISIYQPLLSGLIGLPADNSIKNDEFALEMSKESLRDIVTASVGNLKKYFVQIYRQKQYLSQNTLAIEYAQNTMEKAKGVLSAAEQLEAKAFLLSRQAQQAGYENNVKSACEDFLNYAGYEAGDWDTLTIDSSSMTEEAYMPSTLTAELEDALVEAQPQVARARIQYENTKLWMDQAGFSELPQLDLNASMQLSGYGNTFSDSIKIMTQGREKYYSAGLNFNFDIPNSGQVFDEKYWEAGYERDQMNYKNTKNSFRRSVRDAWRNAMQARGAYEMRKEAAGTYLKRLDMVKDAFSGGAVKVREMDLSINDAAGAQASEADSYYNYIAALSDWNRLSGKYEGDFNGYMKDK